MRTYTSWGRTPMPMVDRDGVLGMTVPNPEGLLAYAKGVVAEMFALYPLGWYGTGDPVEAMKVVEAGMAAAHPELDVAAVSALGWTWSYSDWK